MISPAELHRHVLTVQSCNWWLSQSNRVKSSTDEFWLEHWPFVQLVFGKHAIFGKFHDVYVRLHSKVNNFDSCCLSWDCQPLSFSFSPDHVWHIASSCTLSCLTHIASSCMRIPPYLWCLVSCTVQKKRMFFAWLWLTIHWRPEQEMPLQKQTFEQVRQRRELKTICPTASWHQSLRTSRSPLRYASSIWGTTSSWHSLRNSSILKLRSTL